MKKLIGYIIPGIMVLAIIYLVACDKERLDLPPHTPSEADYFQTANQFNRTIFGVYAKMSDFFVHGSSEEVFYFWLQPSDQATNAQTNSFETFEGNSPSSWFGTLFFEIPYQIINRANIIIDTYKKIDLTGNEDKEQIENAVGEAYFLRSYWYYFLVNSYGTNIPLVLERKVLGGDVTRADLNTPSIGSYTAVFDQCIDDLETAIPLLADSHPAKMAGRVTKSSASGLLAKLYCFRACYGGGNSDYTAALTAIGNIDDSHDLMTNFSDNFDVEMENNAESLFEYQASNAPSMDNIWLDNDFDIAIGRMSIGYACFVNEWGYHYWGQGTIAPTHKIMGMFDTAAAARDPRFDETFTANGDGVIFPTGYMIDKFTKHSLASSGLVSGDFQTFASTNNFRMLRMADIKLLQAEALAQTGDLDGAVALVNEIRTRARNSGPTSTAPADRPASASLNEVMGWIMDERALELAFEGHRWFDLKRWDAAGYIDLSTWDEGPTYFDSNVPDAFKFDYPKDLVYPVPESELNNNPEITPN